MEVGNPLMIMMWEKDKNKMESVKINQLHAFEFDNGQDLLHGPVGTWFIAREDQVIAPEYNPSSEEMVFVRSQSCGPGWYQSHPKEKVS